MVFPAWVHLNIKEMSNKLKKKKPSCVFFIFSQNLRSRKGVTGKRKRFDSITNEKWRHRYRLCWLLKKGRYSFEDKRKTFFAGGLRKRSSFVTRVIKKIIICARVPFYLKKEKIYTSIVNILSTSITNQLPFSTYNAGQGY